MAATPSYPHLSIDRLLEAAGLLTDLELSQKIGASRRALHRWRRSGIPLFSADQAACELGLHPINVWGDEYWLVDA